MSYEKSNHLFQAYTPLSFGRQTSRLFAETFRDSAMVTHIRTCTEIPAAGTKPKIIEEFFGRVNSNTDGVSIARMKSPAGWEEPAQIPEFDEFTVVLKGMLQVSHENGVSQVKAGEAFLAPSGERVRYSTPEPEGAEYIAVCIPAFSPDLVNREE
jgi:mannose-6-phosphate isomerase-like protein (cupin superfamily)